MNKKLHHALPGQAGMTMLSWLLVIAFLVFQAILAMNIVPVYISDSSVTSMMKGMEADPSLAEVSSMQLRENIAKRLKINNIYSIKKEDISIKKAREGYLVTIEYEPRGTLVGSLDFIVTFKHEALIRSRFSE